MKYTAFSTAVKFIHSFALARALVDAWLAHALHNLSVQPVQCSFVAISIVSYNTTCMNVGLAMCIMIITYFDHYEDVLLKMRVTA